MVFKISYGTAEDSLIAYGFTNEVNDDRRQSRPVTYPHVHRSRLPESSKGLNISFADEQTTGTPRVGNLDQQFVEVSRTLRPCLRDVTKPKQMGVPGSLSGAP